MTLIGSWIENEFALCWADTEFYRDENPSGYCAKLYVNNRAGFVTAGRGTLGGNQRIKAATNFADSLSEFCEGLPSYFEAEARNFCELFELKTEWPNWECIAAGWFPRLRRFIGVRFKPPNWYPQVSAGGHCLPYVREFDSLSPSSMDDVFRIARSQMEMVRKEVPLAGAGSLTVAYMRREKITLSSFDLQTGAPAASPEEVGEPVSHLLR